ncbi:MAG: TIGR03985 family CRISPR-associated protein [Cyanobacteria bacterium P01_A01_bin.123]
MVEPLWQALPTVPLLQWLARGALKQNLLQSIRLWVWLHLLYGEAGQTLGLTNPFTYADWRDCFFSTTHPTEEKKPNHLDPNCPCNKVTAAWLFAPAFSYTQSDWEGHAQTHSAEIQTQIRQFAQSLKTHDQLPSNLDTLLNTCLFSMTRRTLYNDLRILTSISWLTQQGQSFYRVTTWPIIPQAESQQNLGAPNASAFLTQPDLAAIAENLSREIQGDRRFFVHVDYVVPQHKLDRVDDWQAALSDLWQQTPTPPVRLRYQGAGHTQAIEIVVYPVCIYYFRRGPYLCGFGQVPNASPDSLDWRNYRLDRILEITPLAWTDPTIPKTLADRQTTQTLPHPDEIATRMAEAWGFDYYQPAQLLLLRFDKEWNDRYIRDTKRHDTFEQVSYTQAQKLIRQHLTGKAREELLRILDQRSPEDAYYSAIYREHDPNVHQRLRAWRPRVEVLLPCSLRQQFAAAVRQEHDLYW